VITRGDYQEDGEEYGRLLDELTEQFQPEGIAEALEVQKIALAYWRKVRAVRYEHGAIRTRTGTMRAREERKRREVVDKALAFPWRLESTAGGFEYLIESLENIKQQVLDGQVPRESIDWLIEHFPKEFYLPDDVEINEAAENEAEEDEAEEIVGPPEYLHELAIRIPRELHRLYPLRKAAAQTEELQLESKILAAAIPTGVVVDKLVRYETSIERELDRALERLERMQKRRRVNDRVSTAEPESA